MDHPAVLPVLEGQLDRVADPHAEERSRHLAVERPVGVGRLVGQPADQLHGLELDLECARRAGGQRSRQVHGVAHDAHRRRQRDHRALAAADGELALHAGLPVAGQRAEVRELTALVHPEHGDAARALPRDLVGASVELGEHDVVLDAIVVDEGDLHDIPLRHSQRGIDDALDGPPTPTDAILPSASSVRRRRRTVGVYSAAGLFRDTLGAAAALGAGAAGFACATCRWPGLAGSAATAGRETAAITTRPSHTRIANLPPLRLMIVPSLSPGSAWKLRLGYDADHIPMGGRTSSAGCSGPSRTR